MLSESGNFLLFVLEKKKSENLGVEISTGSELGLI